MTFTRPVLCLVTDRRRLASRIGVDPDSSHAIGALLDQIAAAAEAGLALVQIREPDLSASVMAALVRAAVRATMGSPARVVVNDRIDVALAAGASGAHLKAESVDVADARRLAPPGWVIGRSVHGVPGILEIGAPPDYLVAGAVFPTPSKPAGWPRAGLDGLRAMVEAAGRVPVLAIGGIGPAQAGAAASAGAAGLAGIGLWLPPSGVPVADAVHETAREVRKRFDSEWGVT